MAFPTTPILDTFQRANTGPPPSASWTTSKGTGLKIVSNQCVPNVDTLDQAATWSASSFVNNQECYFTLAAVPTSTSGGMACCARLQNSTDINSNHYELDVQVHVGNDGIQLYKQVSTTYFFVGSEFIIGRDFQIGDEIGLQVKGNIVRAWFNRVLVITAVDNSIPSGGFIGLDYEGSTGGAYGSFGGGAARDYYFLPLLGVGGG
jgi:hypothetical protein